jgi:hypothetical protein
MTLYGNKMTIFASKLAACADMNRFVNRDELADAVVKNKRSGYATASPQRLANLLIKCCVTSTKMQMLFKVQ